MSDRSRTIGTTVWLLAAALPLAACSAPVGSGPSGVPSGSSATEAKSGSPATEAPTQSALVVDFDGIPAPQDCDPAAPKLEPLDPRRLLRRPIDNLYVQGGGAQAILADAGPLQVSISVYSSDPKAADAGGAITRYLDELVGCFEILQGGPPGGFDELSVEAPEATLLKGVVAATGLDPAALRARRDVLMQANGTSDADGVGVSLDEVVTDLGEDSEKVLNEAVAIARANIDAAETAGTIAAEQADGMRLFIDDLQLDALYRDPDAPILTQTPADPGETLITDPGSLEIDLALEGQPAKNAVVFFALDPRVHKGEWHFYSWRTDTSVSTKVKAEEGKVCDYLVRMATEIERRGVKCAIAVETSDKMTAGSYEPTWYSARVLGKYKNEGNGNKYELFGTWRDD